MLEIGYWARWTFALSSMAVLMLSVLTSCRNLIKGHLSIRNFCVTRASSLGPAARVGLPVIYDSSGSYN